MPAGPAGATGLAAEAVALAEAFAAAHQGRVGGYDAAALYSALAEYERLETAITAAGAYAALRFDADTDPPEHGALLAAIDEQEARLRTLVTFFELEWIALEEARAAELMAAPELGRYAHLLAVVRTARPHRLSGPEERILTEKALTAADAWQRLLEEQLAGLEPEIDSRPVSLDDALAELSEPDRDRRLRAARAVTAALAPELSVRVRILNVLLADHQVEDRLRRYPHWLAARNRENETSDASVQALVAAVVARYDIARRWSALKARALGLPRLSDHDRLAPVGASPQRYSWSHARELVVASYTEFSPELGAAVEAFFSDGRIDAASRAGKAPGAYCAATAGVTHPYVLLNFSGRREDVLTLAHELGHGLHFQLAAPRGVLLMDTPLTVAETASVFGETLAFAHLLSREDEPSARFGLLAYQLDEAVATVFRQVAIHRFEDAVHTARRTQGELSADAIADHWISAHRELYGDAVVFAPDYRAWWSQVSHVFVSPGYVYAYAYGQLLALSIYARYRQQGESFVPRYVEMLAAGGSRSPAALAAIVGVALDDPDFWDAGLALIDEQLAEAERAYEPLPG